MEKPLTLRFSGFSSFGLGSFRLKEYIESVIRVKILIHLRFSLISKMSYVCTLKRRLLIKA